MSSQEIEHAISEIREQIIEFLSMLDAQMDESRLDEVVEGDGTLESDNIGQLPERCVEDALIWPILGTLGFEVTPRPYYPVGDDDERPDFRVDNLTQTSETVIGENKSLNRFEVAKKDIRTYLDSQRYEYGIATDGLRWGMYEIETDKSGRAKLVDVVEEQNLKPAVQRIARSRDLVNYNEELQTESSVEAALGEFYQTFSHYQVRRAIGGLSEFYDLYREIISGGGEYENHQSNLVDGLDAPKDATYSDKLAFSTLLVDRLAFLKLLIDRNLLENVVLHDEWKEHIQGLNRFRGSFYSQYLQPLFYNALSEPPQHRDAELNLSYREVPYLGGGLFEPLLLNEREYDVPDDVMEPVLVRFVEGEGQTLINEAANGSLLESYTENESRDIVGQMPEYYSTIVEAYAAEIDHVESEIKRTLRSYAKSG